VHGQGACALEFRRSSRTAALKSSPDEPGRDGVASCALGKETAGQASGASAVMAASKRCRSNIWELYGRAATVLKRSDGIDSAGWSSARREDCWWPSSTAGMCALWSNGRHRVRLLDGQDAQGHVLMRRCRRNNLGAASFSADGDVLLAAAWSRSRRPAVKEICACV